MSIKTDVQREIISVAQGIIIILIIGEKFLYKYKSKISYDNAKKDMIKEIE